MGENASRRSLSNRAKIIMNMIEPSPVNKLNTNLQKIEKKIDSVSEKTRPPVPDDYLNKLYARSYSMTSSIFNTFCETQTSNYHAAKLPDFNDLNLKENDVDMINNKTLENATVQSHVQTVHDVTPPTTTDLDCHEVMPLESPICDDNETENMTFVLPEHQYDFDSDDSVRDKDYNPEDTSSDDDLLEDRSRAKSKEKKSKISIKTKTVSASIAKNFTTLLDSVSNRENRKLLEKSRRSSFIDLTTSKRPMCSSTLIGKRRHTVEVEFCQQLIEQPQEPPCDNTPEMTSLLRKRRKYSTSALQRKMDAKNIKRLKHFVKQGCDLTCLKKCSSQMSQIEREAINNSYWDMTFQEQHSFVSSYVSVAVPKRKTTSEPKRKPKRTFFLKKLDGSLAHVCKIFFLTTLGYVKTNDRILHDIRADPFGDKRGKHQKTIPYDRNLLTQHVQLFDPLEPHYRREHAPLRRYLPSDLNIAQMHKHFCESHPDKKVSYELYRQHVKQMNISFTRLGNEECETCETYNLHKKETSHDQNEDCSICTAWVKHHDKYLKARKLYDEHKITPQNDSDIYFSADLEKVIMLPRLDTFKSVIFCHRLVAYNQTFAPLGKISTESKPLTVLWHDGIAGRKQEDIMTAFYHFLIRHRDITNIHIWLDNCMAQNKNWLLYSLLVHMVNSENISAEKIMLYYFEPGHTFMSCDQVHHQVELAMKKKAKLYDFADFEDAVSLVNNSKVSIKSLPAEHFLNIPNYVSDRRVQNSKPRAYLKNMTHVCFTRNKFDIMYKNNFEEEYLTLRFMNDRYLKNPSIFKIDFRSEPKGVDLTRKEDILEKLSGIIPKHKLVFWKNLPVNKNNENASTSRTTKRGFS